MRGRLLIPALLSLALSCTEGLEPAESNDSKDDKNGKTEIVVPSSFFLPYSQNFTMMSAYSPMTEYCGTLDFEIASGEDVFTLKLSSASLLSGRATHDDGTFIIGEGLPEIVFNACVIPSNRLNGGTLSIPVLVLPGEYSSGLTIRICDITHRVMYAKIDPFSIGPGESKKISIEFEPDPEILYFEGYDSFVWGSNYASGTDGWGPASTVSGTAADPTLLGYERAETVVPAGSAGSGYIQPNDWNSVSGKTVAQVHSTSNRYLQSRGISDYNMLFRCQEFQGCIGVGIGGNRGILTTGRFGNMKTAMDVSLEFDLWTDKGNVDDLVLYIYEGGSLESLEIDSKKIAASLTTMGNYTLVTVPRAELSNNGGWQHFKAVLSHASSSSYMKIFRNLASSGYAGFLLDNILVKKLNGHEKSGLRVLYWNIQNGMWSDQGNEYDNFVEWVKRYDPDICVWCEASTIYETGTYTAMDKDKRYLPSNWDKIAARYGHNHTSLGAWKDNYPQAITSKYPIEKIADIYDLGDGNAIMHGAGLFSIEVSGRKLNFVTLHLWPQKYSPKATDRDASAAKFEGYDYKKTEMNGVLKLTVNNPSYSSEKDWMIMGDLNSRLFSEDWVYKLGEESVYYSGVNEIVKNSDCVDILSSFYPGKHFSSTYSTARVDYVFASPSLFKDVCDTYVVMDDWTMPVHSTQFNDFYLPSDHRPILVDIKL